jgi:hypothetical protein
MDDLGADIEASRAAYVGLAVTEIATLRGELGGRRWGSRTTFLHWLHRVDWGRPQGKPARP